jgi:Protein of unknown function (DUF3309)
LTAARFHNVIVLFAGEIDHVDWHNRPLIILILILVGALPTWPYSADWGYYPAGGLGLIVVILIILLLLGRI